MLTAVTMLLAVVTAPCEIAHLVLAIPATYACKEQAGPDFSVLYVYPADGSDEGSLGVYVGNAPRTFAPKGGGSSEPAMLGPMAVTWHRWLERKAGQPDRYRSELLAKAPFAGEAAGFLHLFVSAATPGLRVDLQRLALTIRPRSLGATR